MNDTMLRPKESTRCSLVGGNIIDMSFHLLKDPTSKSNGTNRLHSNATRGLGYGHMSQLPVLRMPSQLNINSLQPVGSNNSCFAPINTPRPHMIVSPHLHQGHWHSLVASASAGWALNHPLSRFSSQCPKSGQRGTVVHPIPNIPASNLALLAY